MWRCACHLLRGRDWCLWVAFSTADPHADYHLISINSLRHTQKGAAPLPESHCKGAAWGNFLPAKYFNSIVLVCHIRGVGEQLHTNQTPYPAMSRMKPWALNVYSWTYAFCRERLACLLEKICNPKWKPHWLLTSRVSPCYFSHIHWWITVFCTKKFIFTCSAESPKRTHLHNCSNYKCDMLPL